MKRAFVAIVLSLGLAVPAVADVTIKQSTTGKGMGFSGTAPATTYIKGNKMRTDTVTGDTTRTMIFDVDTQKLLMFDNKKKEADVYDMATFGKDLQTNVDTSNIKASLKANGQTKEIAGKTASGYDMEVIVPAALGNNKEMTMTITMSGPTWIVKGGPGSADYIRFYKAAVDKGWIFTDPRAAKGQPGQAKAMAQMYKELAEAGGIAYQTDMQMKMSMAGADGGGRGNPLGGLFAKMGNVQMSTTVDAVETGALADDLFAAPAGYKLNPKK